MCPTDLGAILRYVPQFREKTFVVAVDGAIVDGSPLAPPLECYTVDIGQHDVPGTPRAQTDRFRGETREDVYSDEKAFVPKRRPAGPA